MGAAGVVVVGTELDDEVVVSGFGGTGGTTGGKGVGQ